MLRPLFAAAAAAVTTLGVSSAAGSPPMPRPVGEMHTGAEVSAPYAFYDFCVRTPEECKSDPQIVDTVNLTPERWAALNEVNDVVNETVIPKSDWDNYGVADYWAIANRYGDCEDYALTKQLYLRQRGFPMGALLMTVVLDENGDGHAILTVRTSRGDLMLDNRRRDIYAWSQVPYKYIKRQSTRDPHTWLTLNTNPVPHQNDQVATTGPTKK